MLNSTQLTVQIPAVQGGYGHRLMTYATQIAPRSLEAFLGHDPRSRYWKKLDPELEQIYAQLQRTTSPERLRAIQSYVRKRFSQLAVILGAFPSISVAVKRHLRFDQVNDSAFRGAGMLHLDMSKSNGRIVLDGLARVSGVIELVELANDEALSEAERKSLNDLIDQFTLPLVIFAPRQPDKPLEIKELRQLFADFNFKQTSINQTMAMNYDSSDIYVEATRRLAERPVVKSNGGMETKAASLGAKSTALVVLQHLVRFMRGAAEGDTFAEAKANVDKAEGQRRLSEDNLGEFVSKVERFLGGMAESMGASRFSDTKNSIHLTGPGWGALGAVFHDLDATLGIQDMAAMGRKLGELDWKRDADFWSDVMREKEVRGKMTLTFIGGGYESRQAIRRKAHQHLGTWDQLRAKTEPTDDNAAIEDPAVAA